MPKRARKSEGTEPAGEQRSLPVRSLWSGTITFGLVSIPVDLFSAARPRQKQMKLVDKDGHPLGREYHCSKEGKKLSNDELVRGYETESGKMVVITDAEFESVAPEMSRDIELHSFVDLAQIPPLYFDRPYYLAPAGRSTKAYTLLATTMERSGRVGIGRFVMRGHENLVAILSENGVLRATTLRHADEIRKAEDLELPKRSKPPAKKVTELVKDIEALTKDRLDLDELEDREAEALHELAEAKQKQGEDVIKQARLEDAEPEEGSAQIIDLMAVLKKSLSKNVKVSTGQPTGQTATVLHHPASKTAASKPAARKAAPRKATRSRTKRASGRKR